MSEPKPKWTLGKIFLLSIFVLLIPGMFLLWFWDWISQTNRDEETALPWGGLRLVGPIMGGNLWYVVCLLLVGYFCSWWLSLGLFLAVYAAIVLWFVIGVKFGKST